MRARAVGPVAKGGIVGSALLLAAASAAAAPPPGESPQHVVAGTTSPAALADTAHSSRITLITGDEVVYRTSADGSFDATVTIDPDSGTRSVHAFGDSTGVYVIPDQAQPLVTAGVLDRELFDVKYLAEHGYADADTDGLPVIVGYRDAPSAGRQADELARAADTLPAASDPVALHSIDAVALTVDKSSAESFWRRVRGSDSPAQAGDVARARHDEPMLAPGLATIWLDRKAKLVLDESVAQIGAPGAWASGYDGSGVAVAVLDSGIDTNHPDVRDAVVASKSFIDGEDVVDGHGHGTHVASTIAGTGGGSDGRYTGVAPGADLLVGKVCLVNGDCPSSALIAGMEWAVAQGAQIVNVSIGADPTDGTDPTSLAVNELSAASGALFVISAGNNGPGDSTIGSPGAAQAALTVGALDKADQLANFSSRGPRVGDSAIKPDIVAPGVDIVAARAAGTTIPNAKHVGEHYTTVSGTSMAAPHVAGAAAIVAQQHPQWSGEQIKSALTSTAHDAGYSPYEQGAGRVDVARVVDQQVFATTAADFGSREWPHDAGTATRTVTYRNLATTPTTLDLSLSATGQDGEPAPAGLLELSAESLTVPAGGTADVQVRLTESRDVVGVFGGHVTATDGAGAVVTTSVGVQMKPETFTVQVNVEYPEDSWHNCLAGHLGVLDDVEDARYYLAVPTTDNCTSAVFDVPAGTYMIDTGGLPDYYDAHGRPTSVVGVLPEVVVTADTELTIDLNAAKPLEVDTPQPSEAGMKMVGFNRVTADGYTFNSFSVSVPWINHVAIPTEPVDIGHFELFYQPTLIHPRIELSVAEPTPMALHPTYFGRADQAMVDGSGRARLIFVGAGGEADFAAHDVRGAVVLARAGDAEHATLRAIAARAQQAGALAVLQFWDGPQQLTFGEADLLPVLAISRQEGTELVELAERGPVELRYAGTPETPYTYNPKVYYDGRVPDSPATTLAAGDFVEFTSRYHAETGARASTSAHVRGPHDVGSFVGSLDFAVPAERTDYYGPLDPDLTWNRWYLGPTRTWMDFDVFAAAGPPKPQSWDLPAAVPGVVRIPTAVADHADDLIPPACAACRHADQLSLFFQTTNGLDGAFTVGDWPVYTGVVPGYQDLHVTVDGEEVPVEYVERSGIPGLGNAALPIPTVDLPARARVGISQRLNFGVIPGWSNIETRWEFTSARPGADEDTDDYRCIGAGSTCSPASMIFLGYDLSNLALDNTTVAEHGFSFVVEPYHQLGAEAAITAVNVQVSFDDGESWQAAGVEPRGDGTYRVSLQHPPSDRSSGAVSVRVTAHDDEGGSVEQTLERLYELAPDACPGGHDDPTIVFDDQDSGVPNEHLGDGCTFLDLVWAEAPFAGHGQFVRVVRDLTDQWRQDGLLDRRQAQAVTTAAARSGIGRNGPAAARSAY